MTPISLVLLLLVTASVAVAQQCYAMDGTQLSSEYQPCKSDKQGALFSACCKLNGTDGYNDICMDSGLCMSTWGWASTFIWANGCTDPNGTDLACPQQCSSIKRAASSFNILPCNVQDGKFCCRAWDENENCCNTDAAIISVGTIGQLFMPDTRTVPGTTTLTTSNITNCDTTSSRPTNPSTTASTQANDKSGVVGGAVGGVLGAGSIALLVVLFIGFRNRRSLRSNYVGLQREHDMTLQNDADERAALQQQLQQERTKFQQYQHQVQSAMYTLHGPLAMNFVASPALPMGDTGLPCASDALGQAQPVKGDTEKGAIELSDASTQPEK